MRECYDCELVDFYHVAKIHSNKKCKKEKINIIHAHWVVPQGVIAALYKKYFNNNIRLIITCPGGDILDDRYSFKNYFKKKIIKFSLDQADAVVTISLENEKAIRTCGYENKIYIIPYGIDTNYFHPNKKDENLRIKYNIRGKFGLYVGNIIVRKGVKYIIEAAQYVIKVYSDFKFIFLGVGNELNKMKMLANKLGISENIYFLGFVSEDEKAAFLATADIFVFPSLSEGFGLVNIEAMSSETVPIVSDIPVFREIIQDGVTGIITVKENSEKLANAIIDYFENSQKYSGMGKIAREEVVKRYDWNVILQKYCDLIDGL